MAPAQDGTRVQNMYNCHFLMYTCIHMPFFNVHIMYACQKMWDVHKMAAAQNVYVSIMGWLRLVGSTKL